MPGRAPGPEGIKADLIEAADTPRRGSDCDVVTIRKFEPCPQRGYVEEPQTWARKSATTDLEPRLENERGWRLQSVIAVAFLLEDLDCR